MYCYNCGKKIPDDSLFCSFCGVSSSPDVHTNMTIENKDVQKANSINAIVCPQCGSADIVMENDKNGVCNSCGTRISLASNDTYNFFINDSFDDNEETGFAIFNIRSRYSADDCKRFVLDELAKDDSPIDVYDADFSEPELKEHIVLCHRVEGIVDYTVSIGYDKKEPYQTTESYYDASTRSHKERVVTKYKDIIEWSPLSSSSRVSSIVFVDNECNPEFDGDLFYKCFKSDELEDNINEETVGSFEINEQAHATATEKSALILRNQVINSLPGDHYKDFDSHLSINSFGESIITVPCYYMNISYNGNNYTKKFFPVGDYNVGGDEITGGLKESDSGIWSKIKIYSIIVCLIMITSMIISITIDPTWYALLLPIGALIFHEYMYKKIRVQLATDYLKRKEEACDKKKREMGL